VDYAWLDITEANVAYWAGETGVAVFERQLLLGGPVQYWPPPELTELNAGSWAAWAEGATASASDETGFTVVGSGSVRFDTTGGADNYLRYAADRQVRWNLSAVNVVRVWFYAENPNFSFQERSPWIRLGNADGYFEWRTDFDILNQAMGQWVEFVIPIAGDDTWHRTEFGSPAMDRVHYVEIHADTWGAGFTLWVDGLRFDPPPVVGDLDGDGDLDIADYAIFAGCMTGPNGGLLAGCGPSDLDADRADVDLPDYSQFQDAF
jgi:hypothetical protein